MDFVTKRDWSVYHDQTTTTERERREEKRREFNTMKQVEKNRTVCQYNDNTYKCYTKSTSRIFYYYPIGITSEIESPNIPHVCQHN
jgi:hypothetical protein